MGIYAPSTRMVRYTGDVSSPVKFVKYYKGEIRIVVKKGDVLILPAPVAMKISRKRNFELVEFNEQAELLGSTVPSGKAKVYKKTKAEEETKSEEKTKVDNEVIVTADNIMDESLISLSKIKALCKQNKITVGKKSRRELASALLPFVV